MQPQTLEKRVQRLERRMTLAEKKAAHVAALESQIPQLREEMREGVSAIRSEIEAGDKESRGYMRTLYEDTLERIRVMGEGNVTQSRRRID